MSKLESLNGLGTLEIRPWLLDAFISVPDDFEVSSVQVFLYEFLDFLFIDGINRLSMALIVFN